MKKVFLLVLAAAMVFGCVSSYAHAPMDNGNNRGLFGKVTFDEMDGGVGGSFLDGAYGSDVNRVREDWTNSRGLDNSGALFVNLDGDIAVEVTGSAYISADSNANAQGATDGVQLMAYVDLKYVKDAEFCGLVLDYTNGGYGSTNDSFTCVHPGFILESGYGFSLRAGNKMDIFVNASASENVDAGSFDLSKIGIDSSEFVTYAIYRTTDKIVYITANNILVGTIDFSADQPSINNPDGSVAAVASGDPSRTNPNYNTDGFPFFGIVGDGDTDVFFDNIGYEEFEELPDFDTYTAPTEEPKTEEPAEEVPAYDTSLVYNCTTGNNIGVWLQTTDTESLATVFNVSKAFNEIKLDIFWASNPPTSNGTMNYNFKVDIYKFSYNYANSIAGTPVASAALIDIAGDNYNTVPSFSVEGTNLILRGANNGIQFILPTPLPAGQYVMVITNDAGEGSYLVLPTGEGELADCKFFRGTEDGQAIRFALNTSGQFVSLIADQDVPAPQTGDMTVAVFAVIAVVALAAIVVLKKRVNA